jgi:glucokinase
MTTHYFLVWDLGGTKCSAGLIEYDVAQNHYTCLRKTSVQLKEMQSVYHLTEQIEHQLGLSSTQDVDAICVGAAGQYDGSHITLESGYPYPMALRDVAKKFKWPSFAVIHDYATILCATFTNYLHSAQHVKRLNAHAILPFERRVAFGLGTGLGLKDGLQLENGDFWLGTNEMGHIGIPTLIDAFNERMACHHALLSYLQKAHQSSCITFEQILSGPGLRTLYRFFHPMRDDLSAEDIGHLLKAGQLDELANTFAWYLGLFVATIQLTFMPAGGIWMTGGVLLKHLGILEKDDFEAGIRSLPAYLSLRKQYPLGVLCHDELALIGAGFYASKRLLPKESVLTARSVKMAKL